MRARVAWLSLWLAFGCASLAGSHGSKLSAADVFGSPIQCTVSDPDTRLANGAVVIQSGETLCVDLKPSGQTVAIEALASTVGPTTLIVRMTSDPSTSSVFLSLYNPFPKPLKYQAGMNLPGEDSFHATSSCPVAAGGGGAEHWPHRIEQLILTDFRLLEADDKMACD